MPEKTPVGSELGERGREILQLVISSYISSGEPVGSRTVSKAMNQRLSPASIRNIMADLEDAGYLMQPHTSAGRVPSDAAYRFFVDCLGNSGKPTRSDEAYINKALAEASTPEHMMSTASHLLSDICRTVGIVVSPPIETSMVQHIEFVRLGEDKILVIMVSQSGLLQQKLIRVAEPYNQDELTRAGNYLVDKFSGKTLPEIRHALVRMMRAERMRYDRMMRRLLESWSLSLDEPDEASETVYIQGTGNILTKIDLSNIERMQELFGVFEEKGRLVKILNQCLPGDPEGGVKIRIGSELGAPCMRDFTIIASPYRQKDRTAGFMGIIGPTRMEYRKGISVVGYLANAFSRIMTA